MFINTKLIKIVNRYIHWIEIYSYDDIGANLRLALKICFKYNLSYTFALNLL